MSDLSELADEVRALGQHASKVVRDLASVERDIDYAIGQVSSLARSSVPDGAVGGNLEAARSEVRRAITALSELGHDSEGFADRLA